MHGFLSRGPVQIVHICKWCAMMIFTQITFILDPVVVLGRPQQETEAQ